MALFAYKVESRCIVDYLTQAREPFMKLFTQCSSPHFNLLLFLVFALHIHNLESWDSSVTIGTRLWSLATEAPGNDSSKDSDLRKDRTESLVHATSCPMVSGMKAAGLWSSSFTSYVFTAWGLIKDTRNWNYHLYTWAAVAHSIKWLATGWTTEGS
jgi:hypothetical protein